jgi:hypothetical protein
MKLELFGVFIGYTDGDQSNGVFTSLEDAVGICNEHGEEHSLEPIKLAVVRAKLYKHGKKDYHHMYEDGSWVTITPIADSLVKKVKEKLIEVGEAIEDLKEEEE